MAPKTGVKGTGAFPFHGDVPGFVPARWAGYVDTAAAAGDVTVYWQYHVITPEFPRVSVVFVVPGPGVLL